MDKTERELSLDAAFVAARSQLARFGVDMRVKAEPTRDTGGFVRDGLIELSMGENSATYAAVVKTKLSLTAVVSMSPSRHDPILAFSAYINARTAASLREAGVQYVDAAGNASVRFGEVLIEIQGRRREAPPKGSTEPAPGAIGNLFSTRRSQVILALLAWPELRTGGVRALAAAAGTSVAQAHDTLELLRSAGFEMHTISRPSLMDLLHFWTAAYPIGLGPKLALRSYTGAIEPEVRRSHPDQRLFLSGESAHGLDVVRAATTTVYLSEVDPRLPIVNRWRFDPEAEPNVFVRHKFWTSPHTHEEEPLVGGQNAPWPLVFADLMAANDPRLSGAARAWSDGRLV